MKITAEEIEEKLRKPRPKKKKPKMKVSGRRIFELKKIIANKSSQKS